MREEAAVRAFLQLWTLAVTCMGSKKRLSFSPIGFEFSPRSGELSLPVPGPGSWDQHTGLTKANANTAR